MPGFFLETHSSYCFFSSLPKRIVKLHFVKLQFKISHCLMSKNPSSNFKVFPVLNPQWKLDIENFDCNMSNFYSIFTLDFLRFLVGQSYCDLSSFFGWKRLKTFSKWKTRSHIVSTVIEMYFETFFLIYSLADSNRKKLLRSELLFLRSTFSNRISRIGRCGIGWTHDPSYSLTWTIWA